MLNIPKALELDLLKLVPLSAIADITCLVMYDHHPRGKEQQIDLTFCTTSGQLKEVLKKSIVSSLKLNLSNPSEILILRNSKCELFYLVAAEDVLLIISRKNDELKIHKRLSDVEYYEIVDAGAIGQACLKIVCKDDAVPLIFDDDFESLRDQAAILCGLSSDDSLPVLTHLKSKLTEVKYNVKCNEKTLKSFHELQHIAAFETYKKIHPSLKEDAFNSGNLEMANALKIKTERPWIKVCNNNLVVVVNVLNKSKNVLENVHILIHGNSTPSVTYTTKVFEADSTAPFWKESQRKSIQINIASAITVVIDLEELKQCPGRIEFTGIISYKNLGKDQLLPLERVVLSALDLMGDKFDALSSESDDPNTLLAVLSTTTNTDLLLRHIKKPGEPDLQLPVIFTNYLKMEKVSPNYNIFLHRISPYHLLNGVMIVLNDHERTEYWVYRISLYTRTQSQILAFLNFIYEAIPLKIIATPDNLKITFKNPDMSVLNEKSLFADNFKDLNSHDYAKSILKQTAKTLEYLDYCMMNMNNSKDPTIRSKIGSEIDLYAGGSEDFMKFRIFLAEESS